METKTTTVFPALSFRPFTEQDALTAASWRYPEPYAAYDLDPWDRKVLAALLHAENQYHAILQEEHLAGFFCLGEDARVPGWTYDESALDLGMGLRPDLTGQGQGSFYFAGVLTYLSQHHSGLSLRTTVASWNQRAIRFCMAAGFQVVAKFNTTRKNHAEYTVLIRF